LAIFGCFARQRFTCLLFLLGPRSQPTHLKVQKLLGDPDAWDLSDPNVLTSLEPRGNKVGMPARFTVDAFSAGRGAVEVIVLNPKGQREPCDVIPNTDRQNTYSCAYVPSQSGEYRVIIKFAAKEIMNSPFKVMVEGAADPSKATASGPGIEPRGNQVGRRTFFNIFTTGKI
ncbi:unnamed protein product, partial [Dibothriocephalus latus]